MLDMEIAIPPAATFLNAMTYRTIMTDQEAPAKAPLHPALSPTTLPHVFLLKGRNDRAPRILTENLTPGKTFFEQEELLIFDGKEYRELDARRSKLGAAIAKGCQQFGIKNGSKILYLGASHGYTPSFVSDMIGPEGTMFCLDVAPRVVRDLVFVCEARSNMQPVLGDAHNPSSFAWRVSQVDVVFQDIAQRDQIGIFLKNIDAFLAPGGFGMLALKARSVDVMRRPADIYKDMKRQLEAVPGIVIVDFRELDPFERDHGFFVVKKKA
jgi:fibrillarin-like pre-rRNA processing protein